MTARRRSSTVHIEACVATRAQGVWSTWEDGGGEGARARARKDGMGMECARRRERVQPPTTGVQPPKQAAGRAHRLSG